MTALREYYQRMSALSRNAKLYLLSILLGALGFSIYGLFFNLYVLSLGYSQELVGILAALPALVTAITAIPAGFLGDRVGHRRTLLLGGLLDAVSFLGILTFTSPIALILFTILFGLGSALAQVIGAPFMIENSREEERAHLFSFQFALFMVAGLFGSALGGALSELLHWAWGVVPGSARAYQGILLVATGLVALSLWPLSRLEPPPAGRQPAAIRLYLQSRPAHLARLLLPNALIALGAGLLIPFLNVFFRVTFHLPDALLGLLFAGGGLATAIAALSVPLLARRLGQVQTIVWTQLASIPFLLMMGFVGAPGWAALAYLIRGTLMPMSAPLYSLFMMEQVAPAERATVNGLGTMGWNMTSAVGSWVSGYVQVIWGFSPLFLATTGIYLSASLLIQRYFPAMVHQKQCPVPVEAAKLSQVGGSMPTPRLRD